MKESRGERERRVLKLDLDPEGKSRASIRDIVLLTRKEEGLLLTKGGSTKSVIVERVLQGS